MNHISKLGHLYHLYHLYLYQPIVWNKRKSMQMWFVMLYYHKISFLLF